MKTSQRRLFELIEPDKFRKFWYSYPVIGGGVVHGDVPNVRLNCAN